MDTLTQITLGGAVGELVLGRKVGNKAVLWGAVGGTIPDLDMLAAPFLDPVSQLVFHRGLSHSLVFALFLAPVLGYLIFRIYKGREASWRDWTLLAFWSVVTHPLLDIFTSYGTEFFWPFSSSRIAFSTIFVIDPIYSVPFLICLIVLLFFKRSNPTRRLVNYIGIGLSSFYLLLTAANKLYVNSVFKENLERQNITYSRMLSSPTPFNNFLWRSVAEADGNYWEGYYSLFDGNKAVRFHFIPGNHERIRNLGEDQKIKRLRWFSKGFYSVNESDDGLYFNDLRYGQLDGWGANRGGYVFRFKIHPVVQAEGEVAVERARPDFRIDSDLMLRFFDRIAGK